jgi:hypothetical protein
MIGFDQSLIQFIFLSQQRVNELPKLEAAFLVAALHILESAFILCQYDAKLLVIAVCLHVCNHCVLDHPSVLSEA